MPLSLEVIDTKNIHTVKGIPLIKEQSKVVGFFDFKDENIAVGDIPFIIESDQGYILCRISSLSGFSNLEQINSFRTYWHKEFENANKTGTLDFTQSQSETMSSIAVLGTYNDCGHIKVTNHEGSWLGIHKTLKSLDVFKVSPDLLFRVMQVAYWTFNIVTKLSDKVD